MSSLFDFSLYESFTLIGIWVGLVVIFSFFIFLVIKLDNIYEGSTLYQIIKGVFVLCIAPLAFAIIMLPTIWLYELIGYWCILVMILFIGLTISLFDRLYFKKKN